MKKVIPATSYNSSTTKRGTLIGTLIRIHTQSPDAHEDQFNDLQHAIQIAMKEYLIMGYKYRDVMDAIGVLKQRTMDERLNNIRIMQTKL